MTTASSAPSSAKSPKQARRAALGSYLGATLEFYDFVLYSTASALIFPAVFFAGVEPGVGVVLSYVTLAIGYLSRPVGAIVFGHYGDRIGRRRMLIITMVLMGASSVGIGLIPSSGQIGAAAAVTLVAFRLVQGIAVGGEWAGAALMSIEHATERRQGIAGGIVQSGGPSGAVLATLAFAAVSALPQEQLIAWGWRVPFLASAIVVIAAVVIRLGVTESPEFVAAKSEDDVVRVPFVSTFRENWRSVVLLVLVGLMPFFVQSLTATFALQHAVASGTPQPTVLLLLTVSNFLTIVGVLFFAGLSDRVGRLPVIVGALLGTAVLIWPIFLLLSVPSAWTVLIAFVLLQVVCNAGVTGPLASYAAGLFPVHNRFTGVGITYQLTAAIAAGFAPLIATGLVGAAGGGTWLLTAFVSVFAVVGVLAALATGRLRVAQPSSPADVPTAGN
jgi:MFS family permease